MSRSPQEAVRDAQPNSSDWQARKEQGWRSPLAWTTSAASLFLAVTGLMIFFLPFSVLVQHTVITHTIAGVLTTLPLALYLVRHVKGYWSYPLTQTKFTGWAAGLMAVVCTVSGIALTAEGLFATRIVYAWRTVHIVTTFGLVFFFVPHLAAIAIAAGKRRPNPAAVAILAGARKHLMGAGAGVAVGMAVTVFLAILIKPVAFDNKFPPGYDKDPYGNGPFAPSLATTSTGLAVDDISLADSASCGTSGCHQEIYREWLPSAHRYSAMDVGFQKIQSVMAAQNGPTSTRYCAGCHDPISLFSGTKYIGVENLTGLHGYQEGISCLTCHAIKQTDVKGNANYVIAQPDRYVYELREGKVSRLLADFLIRTYPKHHVDSLSHRMFKTPEFCAACHKQFIDKEVNKVGWVQLQNQYDNWKSSRWNHPGQADQTIECRECHMPLVDSTDPASGDDADFNRTPGDGKHRSHRFLGANQYIPVAMELEGAEEHAKLVEKWLRGEVDVPEIAGRWRPGPVVPIELEAPPKVKAGDEVPVRVHLLNNKAGHDFPTGPLDIIQAWVEIKVTDDQGHVVFHSGTVDQKNFIETGSFMFKAEPVDRYGNLIDRHNLWEMVGVRFKRSMFPGAAEVASYDFLCPSAAPDDRKSEDAAVSEHVTFTAPEGKGGSLHLVARLKYRKFDQYLLNFAFGEDSGLTAPITELSSTEKTIEVLAPVAEGSQ